MKLPVFYYNRLLSHYTTSAKGKIYILTCHTQFVTRSIGLHNIHIPFVCEGSCWYNILFVVLYIFCVKSEQIFNYNKKEGQ